MWHQVRRHDHTIYLSRTPLYCYVSLRNDVHCPIDHKKSYETDNYHHPVLAQFAVVGIVVLLL